MKLKNFFCREDGAVMVLAAISFIIVIVASGIVVDLGSSYMQGSSAQNAADAAALAASSLLPIPTNNSTKAQQVTDMAQSYAQKNGYDFAAVDAVTLQDEAEGQYFSVDVRIKKQVFYSFGPIVGINGTTVTKSAKVGLAPVTSSEEVVPLGIEKTTYSEMMTATQGQNVIVKYGGGGGSQGYFGALDLDGVQGGGAKDFQSWLAFGYGGILRMNDTLPVETGNMAGPTETAFQIRFNQCTHFTSDGGCNETHFVPGCPRAVVMIVYTMVDIHTVKVEGFAPFVLKGLNGNGEIVASKITYTTGTGDTNGTIGGTGDYGIYRSKLVQ